MRISGCRSDVCSSDLSHRQFYDEYNAVLDMPAEYYLDTIKTVFQDHALPTGTWEVRGQRVKPEDVKTVALSTIEGEQIGREACRERVCQYVSLSAVALSLKNNNNTY